MFHSCTLSPGGIDGTAGELGHVCVKPNGSECGCGSKGCLEQYASATGLAKVFTDFEQEFPDSELHGRGNVTPIDLYEYAVRRDQLALAVFDRMGEALGIAIAGFINIFNPEVIVIGGGLSGAWDMFSGSMRETIKARAFRRPAERAKLVRAELGDDSGMIGAASLVFDMRKSG
ncbi:ROK family protein [Leptolyngbya sp. 7M]|uniref:ROK family protein n=1 Tax=Leptolyngbya sp. 7M TaxID=2812896 RepID=UPI001B8D47A6|nr:ROK family protein [Leptolyngbya sp. 7M]QYO62977.1 ROK family protein [Leptolyngbya sp. 7M]